MAEQFESAPGYEPATWWNIRAAEVRALRESVGWESDTTERWEDCLEHSLYVSGVRHSQTQKLVGIGLLAGNVRHALITDLAVHPEHQRQGLGTLVMRDLLREAREKDVTYMTLLYDSVKDPGLEHFYEKFGFESTDEAMELRR